MLFHTLGQSWVFLWMLMCGLFVGVWYDAMRMVSCVLCAGKWLMCALDMVFALGSAALMIVAMVLSNHGELRAYCVIGALCGVVLYSFTIRPLIRLAFVRPSYYIGRWFMRLGDKLWAKKLFK